MRRYYELDPWYVWHISFSLAHTLFRIYALKVNINDNIIMISNADVLPRCAGIIDSLLKDCISKVDCNCCVVCTLLFKTLGAYPRLKQYVAGILGLQ